MIADKIIKIYLKIKQSFCAKDCGYTTQQNAGRETRGHVTIGTECKKGYGGQREIHSLRLHQPAPLQYMLLIFRLSLNRDGLCSDVLHSIGFC